MNKPSNQFIKSNKKPDYQGLEYQNKTMKKALELRKNEIKILKKATPVRTSKERIKQSGSINKS